MSKRHSRNAKKRHVKAADTIALACVYIYRKGSTNRFKVGLAVDVEKRTKRSLRNVDPDFAEFDRIEIDADFVSKCESYLKTRLESKRVNGTAEFFDCSAVDEIESLISECREYFAKYVPVQRAVQLIGQHSDGRWLPPQPEHRATFNELAIATEEWERCDWQVELLQNRLKLAIGSADGLTGLVQWKTNARSELFDVDAFEAAEPELFNRLFEKYRKLSPLKRPFTHILVGDTRRMISTTKDSGTDRDDGRSDDDGDPS